MKYLKLINFLFIYSLSFFSQTTSLDVIRQATSSERIMKNISYFSDVYGPRLMGTPNYNDAILYAKEVLEKHGIETRLESFDKNYRGWDVETFSVSMTAPQKSQLHVYPLAYTKSTNGIKEGELVFINSFEEAYNLKGNLMGKIILFQSLYNPVNSITEKMATRLDDAILLKAKANQDPNDVIIGYHSRISVTQLFENRENYKNRIETFFRFLEEEGVIATIEPSDYPYGLLHVDGNRAMPSFRFANDYKPIASFTMSNEHFGRLLRLKAHGFSPKLKVELNSKYFENSNYNKNLIAEIPGTDPFLKKELVIIGAHLDSWHAGTGAVDNAANCAAIIEALLALKLNNIQPKRTIRLVLWGGEEQIFAGSEFYVDKNVGDMKNGTPKKEKQFISAYLNLDNGAGKIRGLYLMGNTQVEPYFANYLQPFEGDNTLTLQNANQTDHWLFDYQNIPAFQFIQDPLDYISAIHHTNADTFEYVPKEDQEFNADYIAYIALQIANEKHKLPRKKYNYIKPNIEGNTTFFLKGYPQANSVSLVGNFNNWDMFSIPMYKTNKGWEVKIDLPNGKYFYKFIVDGSWTSNPETSENELKKDGKGHGGLTEIYIEK